MVQVKICGLKTLEALDAAIGAGADYIGLVHFSRSPRHVSLEQAAELAKLAHGRVRSVLLLVNPDDELVKNAARIVAPDYIQLHGDESAQRVRAIRKQANIPIIKAVKVGNSADVEAASAYEDAADMLLFDARPPKDSPLPGGNGVAFDWEALTGFEARQKYMLSGGLDPETVAKAVKRTGAPIVDVSSGVEQAPGVKDVNRIRQFIERAKAVDRVRGG